MTKKIKEKEITTVEVIDIPVTSETQKTAIAEAVADGLECFIPGNEFNEIPVDPKMVSVDNKRSSQTDSPVLKVNGEVIPLKAISKVDDYFFRQPLNNYYTPNSQGCYSEWELKGIKESLDWFTASVNGVNFYLTNGSVIDVNISKHSHMYHGDKTPNIYCAMSKIVSEYFLVFGTVKLFNTLIKSSSTTLTDCVMSTSVFTAHHGVSIDSCNIKDFLVDSNERIMFKHVNGSTVALSGLSTIELDQVQHYGHNKNVFKIDLWGSNIKNISLLIKGVSLVSFDFSRSLKEASGQITIDKRLDYGLIAGRSAVPFVRFNSNGILVGEHEFTAVEMLGQVTTYSGVPTQTAPWMPKFEFGSSRALEPITPAEVANKAYRVTFDKGAKSSIPTHQPDQVIIDMVQNVIDQIRSKVRVFTLINTLINNDINEAYESGEY